MVSRERDRDASAIAKFAIVACVFLFAFCISLGDGDVRTLVRLLSVLSAAACLFFGTFVIHVCFKVSLSFACVWPNRLQCIHRPALWQSSCPAAYSAKAPKHIAA